MTKIIKSFIKYSFVILLLQTSAALLINGQTKYKYWYNAPSSPLQIHDDSLDSQDPIRKLDSLFIENISQAAIVSFQLGCIVEKDKIIEIVSEGIVEKLEIKSINTNLNKLYLPRSSSYGNYLKDQCSKGKVSVIRADFIDGGVWTFKKIPSLPGKGRVNNNL